MIEIVENLTEPYQKLYRLYQEAVKKNQPEIQAVCISSYNTDKNEVDSRFVNLKYINDEEWIFFTNYKSPKAQAFKQNSQISCAIYWEKINAQIRLKAKIFKTSEEFSNMHFEKRTFEKNTLSIISEQSCKISNYENIIDKYNKALKTSPVDQKRPNYWGGYSMKPYQIEFWQGHKNRINKRELFEYNDDKWHKYFLAP